MVAFRKKGKKTEKKKEDRKNNVFVDGNEECETKWKFQRIEKYEEDAEKKRTDRIQLLNTD